MVLVWISMGRQQPGRITFARTGTQSHARQSHIVCTRIFRGLLCLSRLRGWPTRSKSAAGGGCLRAGNPDAEAPPPQPSPASGRGSSVPMPLQLDPHMRLPFSLAGHSWLKWNVGKNLFPGEGKGIRSRVVSTRERAGRTASLKAVGRLFCRSVRNMRGLQRVIEHGIQRRGDVIGRVRRVEEARRRAFLQAVRNILDVVVGIGVFVASKARHHG
jgi:hypothetical protein